MAFITTPTPPPVDARVIIKFAGLLLLKPGENNSCEIGIHRLSDTHSFQAMVIVNKPGRLPSVIRLVTGPLTRPIAIDVRDPGPGVRAFNANGVTSVPRVTGVPRVTLPFDRSSPTNHEQDFRWAINMAEIHKYPDFNDGARPVATLNAGTLYTPNLIRPTLNPKLVKGETRIRLHRFSTDLAAAISLGDGNRVVLSWDVEGEPTEFTLPRPSEVSELDTKYTVLLLNDPPISDALPHDEFAHYYEVLESGRALIPDDKRYRLELEADPTTDEIPCMPVVING